MQPFQHNQLRRGYVPDPQRLRSDGGARHWAIAMTLIQTAKLNGIDPMASLTDVLKPVASGRSKIHELHTLLPWNWQTENQILLTAAA